MEAFLVKECVKSTIFKVEFPTHDRIEYGGLASL